MSDAESAASRTLSHREWNDINKYVKLPDEARTGIEHAIVWFRLSRAREEKKPPTALVRSRLNNVARAAQTLSEAIEELSEHERFEMYTSDFLGPEFEEMPSELRRSLCRGISQGRAKPNNGSRRAVRGYV